MAGVNFLKRLSERESEEGIVGEGAPKASFLDGISAAFADLTGHQKTSLILLSLGLGLWFFQSDMVDMFYFKKLIEEKSTENNRLQATVDQLKSEAKGFGELKDQIDQFNRSMADVRSKINEIESIRKAKRDFAMRLTDYAVAEMPEGVWLDGISIDVKTNRKVELRGKSMDLTLIGQYIQRLEKGAFFPKWNLQSTGNGTLPSDNEREIRTFTIDAGIVEVQ